MFGLIRSAFCGTTSVRFFRSVIVCISFLMVEGSIPYHYIQLSKEVQWPPCQRPRTEGAGMEDEKERRPEGDLTWKKRLTQEPRPLTSLSSEGARPSSAGAFSLVAAGGTEKKEVAFHLLRQTLGEFVFQHAKIVPSPLLPNSRCGCIKQTELSKKGTYDNRNCGSRSLCTPHQRTN